MKARVAALIILVAISASGGALDQWTYRSSGLGSANFSAIAYGGGKFVVAGSASGTVLLSSEDGVSWTTRLQGQMPQILDVTYGAGRFLGVGSLGTVMTSTNGETWNSFSVSNTSALMLYAVAHGNGRFVIAGEYNAGDFNFFGTTYTSVDGLTWSNWTSSVASNLRDVAFGNGRFVALGNGFNRAPDPDRRVLVSSNGADWSPRDPAGYTDLRAITFGNGQFVAVARYSNTVAMLTSPDGDTWTPHVLSVTNFFVTRIGFGNGTYIAVGSVNQSRHTLLHSTNGTAWTLKQIGPQTGNYFLYDVAFGDSTFVTVGQPNTIAQSGDVSIPRFERIARPNPMETELYITGEVGRYYLLQYSIDLLEWHDQLIYMNSLPTERVTDATGPDARRFYRAGPP